MFDRRRASILLTLAATLLLAACGTQPLPTAPDETDDGSGYDDLYDGDDDPNALPSVAPSAAPSASPSPGATPAGGPPNDFRRTIGKGYVRNWLSRPAGLATAGNLIFIADGQQPSMLGAHGAIMVFDGASADAFSAYAGKYYERWDGNRHVHLLDAVTQAVAVTDSVVLAADARGVKGFIRSTPEHAINAGKPIAPPCRDLVVAGNVLYMAQPGQVGALSVGSWQAASGLNLDARGLGSDAEGRLWVATAERIAAYKDGERVLDFDARGTDGKGPGSVELQDVAVDPRNGDIYALDRGRVLRFDAAGKFLARFGHEKISAGRSLAVGADGSVYVSDAAAAEVLQYRPGN